MGLSIWVWIIMIIGSVLIGFVFFFIAYFFFDSFRGWIIKRRIPKDNGLQGLANPGKPIKLDEKEVKENERANLAKFREFEKLRRVADAKGRKPEIERSDRKYRDNGDSTKRISKPELLLDEPDFVTANTDSNRERQSRSSKKSIQLHEPADISD